MKENNIPSKAFILAAGLGSRLRPYTDDRPKPLVGVDGRSLLDRSLDQLSAIGVGEVILNTHYLAEQIPAHLKERNDFRFHYSHEEELLDTGGGIKNMLQHFDAPFWVVNGDSLLGDGSDALQVMAAAWDPVIMDILLLLQPIDRITLTQGVGDYSVDADGLPVRSMDKSGVYMFTSIRINHPRIFDGSPDGAFSYRDLMDKAQEAGRLHAVIHDGDWHHISTPKDLEAVERAYKER